MVTHALDAELYSHSDAWRSHLWELTRIVKSWYREGTKAEKAFNEVDREMDKHGGWVYAGAPDDEAAHLEFVSAWKKIRFIKGESPVWQALQKSRAFPVNAAALNPDRKRPTPAYDGFISLVGWLQVTIGDAPIYLPVRLIAEALNTDQRMVSLWRQTAIDDGFIEVVREHEFSAKRRRATEFRVKPSFIEWFKQHMGKKL